MSNMRRIGRAGIGVGFAVALATWWMQCAPGRASALLPKPAPSAPAVVSAKLASTRPDPAASTAERIVLEGPVVQTPIPAAAASIATPPDEPGNGAPSSLLHVVDAGNRTELEGVDIIPLRYWKQRFDHPAEPAPDAALAGALVSGASSPVTIPGGEGLKRFRVRARGYCWVDVELQLEQGAERTIELRRACRLEVLLGEYETEIPLEVRLYPGGWDGLGLQMYRGLQATVDEPTVFTSLAPGDYQVRVQIGSAMDPPLTLAQCEVHLKAGDAETIMLRPDADVLGRPVARLAGTLELPQGASALGIELEIVPTLGPAMRANDALRIPLEKMSALSNGKYRWDAGEVTIGRVKLAVHPLQITKVVELAPAGDRHVRLVVPALAHVVVTMIDAADREPLPVKRSNFGWSRFAPELTHKRFQSKTLEHGSEAERAIEFEWPYLSGKGRFVFDAPVGRTLISVGLAGYDEEGRWVELVPGLNEIEFALARQMALIIGFLDGDTLVPAPGGLTVRAIDSDAEWQRWARVNGRVLGIFEEPGRYRISASDDAEFTFVPEEVTVRTGVWTVIDILVQRRL